MPTQYVLSFTAGGLLYHESVVVAEALQRSGFVWESTTNDVLTGNLLQSRTQSTAKRKLREVRQRLEELTADQMKLFLLGTRLDQRLLLWLACCLRYQLLADFAQEVLRAKFLTLDISIQSIDVENFFESKLLWHDELESLTPTTKNKLQTVIMRMLREAGLVTNEGIIQSPLMSEDLIAVLRSDTLQRFDYFPINAPE